MSSIIFDSLGRYMPALPILIKKPHYEVIRSIDGRRVNLVPISADISVFYDLVTVIFKEYQQDKDSSASAVDINNHYNNILPYLNDLLIQSWTMISFLTNGISLDTPNPKFFSHLEFSPVGLELLLYSLNKRYNPKFKFFLSSEYSNCLEIRSNNPSFDIFSELFGDYMVTLKDKGVPSKK